MAQDKTSASTNGAQKKKAAARSNKPRTLFIVYQGEFTAAPQIVFNKDALVDAMLSNRDLKVEKVTLPVGQRRGGGKAPDGTATQPATPTA